jgi:hypothetical protein
LFVLELKEREGKRNEFGAQKRHVKEFGRSKKKVNQLVNKNLSRLSQVKYLKLLDHETRLHGER